MASKPNNLNQPLSTLAGIGPSYLAKLNKLGLTTQIELLRHYPSRYLDYTHEQTIKELRAKVDATFIASVDKFSRFRSRSGKLITQVKVFDHTGNLKLTWFNAPYISKLLVLGQKYLFAGKPSYWGETLTVVAPTFETKAGSAIHTQNLVPVYPQTDGLSSKWLRTKVNQLLEKSPLPEIIPTPYLKDQSLLSLSNAYHQIHFPKNFLEQKKADQRLTFNYHLLLNLRNLIESNALPPAPNIKIDVNYHLKLEQNLPFKLTKSQQKVIKQAYEDLSEYKFTHRLIQGETGSGKTVIAYFLAQQILKNKYSFVILAPTKILAEQHYQTFQTLGANRKQLQLVTNDSPFTNPSVPTIFIGTHALLTQLPEHLKYPIAAVTVDEQHRFGVDQRESFLKYNPLPHLYNLSATPIPRTIALGIFGEIKFSYLKTENNRRVPPKTWVVDQDRLNKSDDWLIKHLEQNHKVFVVCPLINKSTVGSGKSDVKSIFAAYQKKFSQHTQLFMLHGQMDDEVIRQTLQKFRACPSGILVATTLIEVGIDIPDAQIIIIHSADSFGLAQLHQLRGRVGRAGGESCCFLVQSHPDVDIERLKLLETHHSGLALAKLDLKLRGAGEIFGLKQHGFLPVRLKHFWSRKAYQTARSVAVSIIEENEDQAVKIAQTLASW